MIGFGLCGNAEKEVFRMSSSIWRPDYSEKGFIKFFFFYCLLIQFSSTQNIISIMQWMRIDILDTEKP